jgi:uroporphyrinogen decarboxylase
LTIPDAMGLGLYFSEGEGPKFKNPIQNLQAIEQLPTDLNNDLTLF